MKLFGNLGTKPTPKAQLAAPVALNYADYGYIPGIAQAAQSATYNPYLATQPPFTDADLAAANWFTTRVHLSPLGKV